MSRPQTTANQPRASVRRRSYVFSLFRGERRPPSPRPSPPGEGGPGQAREALPDHGASQRAEQALPLPGGEGWGEGEPTLELKNFVRYALNQYARSPSAARDQNRGAGTTQYPLASAEALRAGTARAPRE